MARLLLLSCSRRKKPDEGLLPAKDRYNGPVYQVLRRYLKQNIDSSLNVRILSGKYGLITANCLLPYYDYRMTGKQAERFPQEVLPELEKLFTNASYTDLLVCMGKDYLKAICGYESIIPEALTARVAVGGLGEKLSILHQWLYGESSILEREQDVISTRKAAYLRGVEINLTSKEILDIARREIAIDTLNATRYQSYYVLVDDQRISPKWLISKITGVSVSDFHTDDAKKVLNILAIPIFLDRKV